MQNDFDQFVQSKEKLNKKFRYWNWFLDFLMPVMTDVTYSFWQAN